VNEVDPYYSEKPPFSFGVVSPEEFLFKAFIYRNDSSYELKEYSQHSREVICMLVKVL
jgi:hypothetical protein